MFYNFQFSRRLGSRTTISQEVNGSICLKYGSLTLPLWLSTHAELMQAINVTAMASYSWGLQHSAVMPS